MEGGKRLWLLFQRVGLWEFRKQGTLAGTLQLV